MRRKLLKPLLLAAALFIGASAWATGTTAGNDQNDALWNNGTDAWYTQDYVLPGNGSYTFTFTTTNSTNENYYGWSLFVSNNGSADMWTQNWMICRSGFADVWGKDSGYNGDISSTNTYSASNPEGKGIVYAMNGASVIVKVTRSSESIVVFSSITPTSENPFTITNTYTYGSGDSNTADVYLNFAVDNAYVNITSATYTPAPISSFPYTSNFTATSMVPFAQTSGTVNTVNSTNCGYLLRAVAAKNGTATATAFFDSDLFTDGNQEYDLLTDEQVTISFISYHGYYNYGETSTFSVNNSEGTSLVSYTYNPNTGKVEDVKLGGSTVDGFVAFEAQSYYINANANGFTDGKKPYQNTTDKNTTITISISENGSVSINFNNPQKSVNATYRKTLSAVKMDLDNLTLTNAISGRDNNADRVLGIGNISIVKATIPKADVTFQFYDTSDNSLSAIKANYVVSEAVGTSIEDLISDDLKESFYGDSYRYDYSTFTCSDSELQEGGSTVNLKFAPKAKYTYSVTAVDALSNVIGEVMSGVAYEGDNTTVYFPYAAQIGGKWYYTTETDFSVDVSTGSVAVNKTYLPSATIVGFIEAESGNVSTNDAQYSGGYLGYIAGQNHTTLSYGKSFGTFGPGVYRITAKVTGNGSRAIALRTSLASDGDAPLTSITTIGTAVSSPEVTLTTPIQTLYVTGRNGDGTKTNQSADFDYVYLEQTGVVTTVGANGYATFASPYALDLTSSSLLPQGVTAYKASVNSEENTVKFTKIDQYIPANTGILLEGSNGQTVNLSITATATEVSGNDFKVNTTSQPFTALENYNYYGLKANSELIFGLFDPATVAIPANKAYLMVAKPTPSSPNAARLTVSFNGEATGISTVEAAKAETEGVYNLNGQRVAAPQKGLYIVNGKKVIMK